MGRTAGGFSSVLHACMTHTHTHTHSHTHIQSHTYSHTHIHTYTHMYMYVYTCTHHMHAHIHTQYMSTHITSDIIKHFVMEFAKSTIITRSGHKSYQSATSKSSIFPVAVAVCFLLGLEPSTTCMRCVSLLPSVVWITNKQNKKTNIKTYTHINTHIQHTCKNAIKIVHLYRPLKTGRASVNVDQIKTTTNSKLSPQTHSYGT